VFPNHWKLYRCSRCRIIRDDNLNATLGVVRGQRQLNSADTMEGPTPANPSAPQLGVSFGIRHRGFCNGYAEPMVGCTQEYGSSCFFRLEMFRGEGPLRDARTCQDDARKLSDNFL